MKIVDENILDGAITSLADALRSRGHFSDKMTFPDGFISKIETGHFFSGQKKYITPMSVPQLISADNGYDCITEAVVYGDAALTSNNIQRGVSIFGVEGNFSGSGLTDSYIDGTITNDGDASARTIPEYFYYGRSCLETVTYPNCTAIGNSAFYGCTNLKSVSLNTFSAAMTSNYFSSGIHLENLYIPMCSRISSSAFIRHYSLISLYADNCIDVLCNAFSGCTSLKTISLPNCTYIDQYAFFCCYSLESAILPSCSYISMYAFDYCSSLTTISIPICSVIGYRAFQECRNLSSVIFDIPVTLWKYAFSCCVNLNTVVFNSDYIIRGYSDWVFDGCATLTKMYMLMSSASLILSQIYAGTPMTPGQTRFSCSGMFYVPESLYETYCYYNPVLYSNNMITPILEGAIII